MSKEKVKKKDKWGSIQYKQAINIYSTKIKKKSSQGPITPHSPHGADFSGPQ